MKWGSEKPKSPTMVSCCKTSSAWLLTLHTSGRLLSSPGLDAGKGVTRSRGWTPLPYFCVSEGWAAARTDPCTHGGRRVKICSLLENHRTPWSVMPTSENSTSSCLIFRELHSTKGLPRMCLETALWELHQPKMRSCQNQMHVPSESAIPAARH